MTVEWCIEIDCPWHIPDARHEVHRTDQVDAEDSEVALDRSGPRSSYRPEHADLAVTPRRPPDPYYQDDLVTIYHGDARDVVPNLAIVPHVIVTDPPYGMAYESGWSGRGIANDNDTSVRDAVLADWTGPALVFGRWSAPRPDRTRHVLIWDKGDWPGMGDLTMPWGPSTEEIYVIGSGFVGKRRGSILRDPHRPQGDDHPNAKPSALMTTLLSACRSEWVILDPFMGGGSTLEAAKNLGRQAIGIELDERWCEAAARRCSQEVLGLAV